MKNSKNVQNFLFGKGSLGELGNLLGARRAINGNKPVAFFIDPFFRDHSVLKRLPLAPGDEIYFVETREEPTTEYVDAVANQLKAKLPSGPAAIVSMGGGIALDIGKAVANLLTNPGRAEDYQGWDLVKLPAVYKIGIPTLSGTGAEASRTCVLMNVKKNLKLGMNSEHTVYDQLVLDPELTRTVSRNQYFYTGMDTYIHCIESLRGSYRNAIGDAFSKQALDLCSVIFGSEDMMSDENREHMMVASYLGGCAIGNSYVGVVHPFSAGLSVVLGTHHCIANCIVMNAMDEFYPDETREFREMVKRQRIDLPTGVCKDLSTEQYERLYLSTIIHEKPLTNALGPRFKEILTRDKVISVFRRM